MGKTETKDVAHVYKAISEITSKMAEGGISKVRKNTQQGFSFRGIDDVYNALAKHLAESGLVILPRVLDRTVLERQTQKGGALFYVTLKVDFDFISSHDGSLHTVTTMGEAMDSGDKATNKAMSAAYKYACLQTFCIPTEGDNDADGTTHDVAAKSKKEQPEPVFKTTEERTNWLKLAAQQVAEKKSPEQIDQWKAENVKFTEALGDKQRAWLMNDVIGKRFLEVVDAPLSDDDIPGDFSKPNQEAAA